ncbi:response regulator [Sphingobacterium cavernae]|jgi:response regulator RpfG family c-di-GMP phosphodiesterase|uniref:response regulator n=1 Tax=Sphingobacterium cavernae TaxID=2592657 RepID=UPI00122FF26C|nr:response regulator [Sphingobacterium cavernae]
MHQVLLIDDNQIMNFIHQQIISSEYPEASILNFENGKSALAHIYNNPAFSFTVFLDINMPIMDGWEFLNALTKNEKGYNLKIFLLSSSIDVQDKIKAKEFSLVESYLVKPLTKQIIKNLNINP